MRLKILNMKEQEMKVLDSPLGRKIVLSADFIISEEVELCLNNRKGGIYGDY